MGNVDIFGINGKSMLISGGAAGGYIKWCPTAAISPLKCGRWHFQNAVGREIPAKPRPVDTQNTSQRPRDFVVPVWCTVSQYKGCTRCRGSMNMSP